jgi:2-dehydro-3-deoxyphosphogluconate aldolase / (4S)-4-hydroxy-2-oxoglutarate aldolase
MDKQTVLETIGREKLVPVVRTDKREDAQAAIETLAACGIKVFEITMTVPDAVGLIADLSSQDILIGAGTVLNKDQAQQCLAAGARFIVSPAFDAATIEYCKAQDVAVMPGSLTPTEVLTAWNAGADCAKVFPCDLLGGAKYLKTLKTLFPHITMMPTGGVSLETIADFFRAGAFAVGVGADLVDVEAIRAGNLDAVGEKARKYLEIVKNL